MTDPVDLLREDLRDELNKEAGKLEWPELARHYARGVVVCVAPELDLIEVAARFVADDKAFVEAELNSGRIARATDDDATRWNQKNSMFWAVVTAPWVLVQEVVEN